MISLWELYCKVKRVAVVERLKLNNVPRETNHRIVSRGTLPLLWFID